MNSDHNSNFLKLELILGAWWLLGSSGKGTGKSWEWWSGLESGGGGAVKVGGKIGSLRGTIAVVAILVKGHTFSTNVKVRHTPKHVTVWCSAAYREEIKNYNAYKEYYAIAIGAAPPKPKASVWRTRSSSGTSITPPTAVAGPRLTKAQQLKLVTKRSLHQTHISQASGSGKDGDGNDDDNGDDGEKGDGDDDDEDDDGDEGDDDDDDQEAERDDDKDDEEECSGEEDLGLNVGREERHVEEEEKDELYRDVNINQGRGIQTTLEVEDSHVTLTPVNPDDQLDWVNPEGQQYPHNLLKPLPLIPNDRGRRVISFDHFINNDLEYLPGGASSRKYTTSITKTKAADYGHIKWIEDLVPRTIWIEEQIGYDKHALWEVSHWGRKHQHFYGFAVNRESARDVYSKRRIIAVTELKIVEWHNYNHLDWITYLPQSIWRKGDKDRVAAMIQAIDKRLKTRRIMRSLERFVRGRLYEGDFRMLQRTI
nr:hypothetical protein [Tanacetum cinerariifolium]